MNLLFVVIALYLGYASANLNEIEPRLEASRLLGESVQDGGDWTGGFAQDGLLQLGANDTLASSEAFTLFKRQTRQCPGGSHPCDAASITCCYNGYDCVSTGCCPSGQVPCGATKCYNPSTMRAILAAAPAAAITQQQGKNAAAMELSVDQGTTVSPVAVAQKAKLAAGRAVVTIRRLRSVAGTERLVVVGIIVCPMPEVNIAVLPEKRPAGPGGATIQRLRSVVAALGTIVRKDTIASRKALSAARLAHSPADRINATIPKQLYAAPLDFTLGAVIPAPNAAGWAAVEPTRDAISTPKISTPKTTSEEPTSTTESPSSTSSSMSTTKTRPCTTPTPSSPQLTTHTIPFVYDANKVSIPKTGPYAGQRIPHTNGAVLWNMCRGISRAIGRVSNMMTLTHGGKCFTDWNRRETCTENNAAFCRNGVNEYIRMFYPNPTTQAERDAIAAALTAVGDFSCDEFPFASSVQGGDLSKGSRICVPRVDQNWQGTTLSTYFRKDVMGSLVIRPGDKYVIQIRGWNCATQTPDPSIKRSVQMEKRDAFAIEGVNFVGAEMWRGWNPQNPSARLMSMPLGDLDKGDYDVNVNTTKGAMNMTLTDYNGTPFDLSANTGTDGSASVSFSLDDTYIGVGISGVTYDQNLEVAYHAKQVSTETSAAPTTTTTTTTPKLDRLRSSFCSAYPLDNWNFDFLGHRPEPASDDSGVSLEVVPFGILEADVIPRPPGGRSVNSANQFQQFSKATSLWTAGHILEFRLLIF
ncbi:hypothetical protein H072_6284 [Dactylellina haptotyla CBS 200.50]|uniref:Deoxyribonuclease NucA/NucB domain-containing protein n=1 Tax=Dactylellina haptotyla (strain CBS 200.50) TaxID=1284197 RepID=S8AAQ2_DACHA|nr:hypothetical protein H072_6284 [Dactylellina haptotyla CBS 200.50]